MIYSDAYNRRLNPYERNLIYINNNIIIRYSIWAGRRKSPLFERRLASNAETVYAS